MLTDANPHAKTKAGGLSIVTCAVAVCLAGWACAALLESFGYEDVWAYPAPMPLPGLMIFVAMLPLALALVFVSRKIIRFVLGRLGRAASPQADPDHRASRRHPRRGRGS